MYRDEIPELLFIWACTCITIIALIMVGTFFLLQPPFVTTGNAQMLGGLIWVTVCAASAIPCFILYGWVFNRLLPLIPTVRFRKKP